jgi:hypothetical protein
MDKITEEQRKKMKGLFTVEVLFHEGLEVRRFWMRNRTRDEIRKFREDVFIVGLAMPTDPGKWVVVSPFDIKKVTLELQKQYYDY